MTRIIRGVIHGSTIELRENPYISDGKEVEVILKTVGNPQPWGEGLRHCAGALAGENPEEDDKILEEIYQERKTKSHREIPE